MLNHVFSALSQSSSIDAINSTLSVISLIEKLTIEASVPLQVTTPLAGIPVSFHVVTVLFNDGSSDEACALRSTLISPTGQQAASHQIASVVQPMKHHRIIANMAGMPYAGDGLYWVEIALQQNGKAWQTVARLPFLLEIKVVAPNVAAASIPTASQPH